MNHKNNTNPMLCKERRVRASLKKQIALGLLYLYFYESG